MNAPLRVRDREPMSETTKTTLWVVGGLIAVGGGITIGYLLGKPKAAGNPYLAPDTSASSVRYYQGGFATALSKWTPSSPNTDFPGLDSTMYLAGEVDGNPKNPRWMAVLAQFQRDMNAYWVANPPSGLPAGYPTKLRTDGVLDYATEIALANA